MVFVSRCANSPFFFVYLVASFLCTSVESCARQIGVAHEQPCDFYGEASGDLGGEAGGWWRGANNIKHVLDATL